MNTPIYLNGVLSSGPHGPLSSRVYLNPNQTHLNKLTKILGITRKLQAEEFDQGCS